MLHKKGVVIKIGISLPCLTYDCRACWHTNIQLISILFATYRWPDACTNILIFSCCRDTKNIVKCGWCGVRPGWAGRCRGCWKAERAERDSCSPGHSRLQRREMTIFIKAQTIQIHHFCDKIDKLKCFSKIIDILNIHPIVCTSAPLINCRTFESFYL